MKKVLGYFLGVLLGYASWMITKYTILMSGPLILMPMGISGPGPATILESIAEIAGFVVFWIVCSKIYKKVVNKNNIPEATKEKINEL